MFSQIALENILFDELRLKSKTSFFNSGNSIFKEIKNLYEEHHANQVALVVIDYYMPGMGALELIKETRNFLQDRRVSESEMPKFVMRAAQFFELPEAIV